MVGLKANEKKLPSTEMLNDLERYFSERKKKSISIWKDNFFIYYEKIISLKSSEMKTKHSVFPFYQIGKKLNAVIMQSSALTIIEEV